MKFRIMKYDVYLTESSLLQGGPSQMTIDFFRGRRRQVQTLEEFYGVNDNDWANDDEGRLVGNEEFVMKVRERSVGYNLRDESDYYDDGGPGRPQTLDEYNADLERSIAQFARGEYMTSEQLKEEMKRWK